MGSSTLVLVVEVSSTATVPPADVTEKAAARLAEPVAFTLTTTVCVPVGTEAIR